MDYSWIGGIFEGAFNMATGVTNTVVKGKTDVAGINANASVTQNDKTENQKTMRTIIIGVSLLLVVIAFGIFVYSKKK